MWFILRSQGNPVSPVPHLLTFWCSHGVNLVPRLDLDACLAWDAAGPPWELRAEVSGSIFFTWKLSPWCCHMLCLSLFWSFLLLVTLYSGHWKRSESSGGTGGKGNAGAGSQPGQGLCWAQGWPWGAPHSQDSTVAVLEAYCAVYFDFLCVQMYVFTIVRGSGGNVWFGCSKQNCIFAFKIQ